MEHLNGILELANAELGTVVKNGKFRSREEIDGVGKIVDMVKDIYCIQDMESGDYDYEGESYARGGRSYHGGDYDDMSYARGRRNAKRDSMGRYSREGGNYRRDGYSRDDGREDMVDRLHEMMKDAPDEKTRQEIKRLIDKMEQA